MYICIKTEQFCKEAIWLTVDEGWLEEASEVKKEGTWVSVEEFLVKEVSVEGVLMEGVTGEVLVSDADVEVSLSEKQVKA